MIHTPFIERGGSVGEASRFVRAKWGTSEPIYQCGCTRKKRLKIGREKKKTKLISQLIILDLYFEKRGFLGDSKAEKLSPYQIEQ